MRPLAPRLVQRRRAAPGAVVGDGALVHELVALDVEEGGESEGRGHDVSVADLNNFFMSSDAFRFTLFRSSSKKFYVVRDLSYLKMNSCVSVRANYRIYQSVLRGIVLRIAAHSRFHHSRNQ